MKRRRKLSRNGKAALRYARKMGWPVFPLDGKKPYRGTHGHKDATTDPEQIREWWERWSEANIGVRCDSREGPIVLDIDGPKGEKAVSELGLGATVEARSGKKGRHYYYSSDGSRVKRQIGVLPEVDILGDGGYVVVPPSIHPETGRRYRWVHHPAKCEMVPFPRTLRDLLPAGSRRIRKRHAAVHKTDVIREGQRDNTLFSLATSMRAKGLTKASILAALQKENELRCEPPLSERDVRRIARQAGTYPRGASLERALEKGEDESGRPIIVVGQELTRETDEALAAIRRLSDHGMYMRGDQLVRVARYRDIENDRVWKDRALEAPALTPVTLDSMKGVMDRAALWVRLLARGRAKSVYPPEIVARQLLDQRLGLGFPLLRFVTETALLTADGVTPEGYDPRNGILYLPPREGAVTPLRDPANRTATKLKRKAQECVEALLDPVCDFPFTDNESRAVYLAGILTALARPAIEGPVPLISCEAPSPGTGKTLLVTIMSLIATGRAPGVTIMAREEEMRKRITSLCLDGAPVVLIDNVSGTVRSDALAALTTSTWWEDRLLGSNRTAKVPNTAQWFVTGNNHVFSGDLGRRVLPIDLDSDREDPENRPPGDFEYPRVLEHVSGIRSDLARSGLILLRAFQLAGEPSHEKPRMGSFEAWDGLVRAAVIWATGWDPASTEDPTRGRGRIRADANEDVVNTEEFINGLQATFKDRTFTAADVLQEYRRSQDTSVLRNVLDRIGTDRKGQVTLNSIGLAFRMHKGKRSKDLKLLKAEEGTRRRGTRWAIRRREIE